MRERLRGRMADQESSQSDNKEMKTITTPWGSYQVPASGFFASVYDPTSMERAHLEQIERGSMGLSLGKFPDLLWMIVPESRPIIAELVRKELDESIKYNLHLGKVSNFELAYGIYVELLGPALKNISRSHDLAVRCLAVIQRTLVEANEIADGDPLVLEIMNRVEAEELLGLVNDLTPDLVALYRRIKSSR
ncbi:hypothetical protein [Actinophytocola xanthii]|uniref:hypothetical protein n=1 Tax=Actinophytocola xanthii TaxID=1912961 RepID=UPI0011774102|nr:hypothetical protein [Actinophytocola xanthii]